MCDLADKNYTPTQRWCKEECWPLLTCANDLNLASDTVQTFNSCTSRPNVRKCQVVQIPINNMSKNKPRTPMTHVAFESKLVSFVRSYMHQGPGNLAAIRHAVVYNAQAAHAFSAGIKCLHCTCREVILYCMFIDCTILYKLIYIVAYFLLE